MKTIFFDESGNTGPDLLNKDQPVYVLCSSDLSDTDSERLLDKYFDISNEVHFKELKKDEKGQNQIIEFFKNNIEILKSHCKIVTYKKDFLVACHFVNYCIEPLYYEKGVDFIDSGFNILYANYFYFGLKSYCTESDTNDIYSNFIKLLRDFNDSNKKILTNSIKKARANCKNDEFKNELLNDAELSMNCLDENLSQLDGKSIDPALSAFVDLVGSWMKNTSDKLEIIHDESGTMKSLHNNISFLSELDGNKKEIGYGDFKTFFPLNINNLIFGKSENTYGIQICDLVSSAVGYIHRNVTGNNKDFFEKLQSIIISLPLTNSVWPNPNCNLIKERKKQPGDINPIDYLAYQYYLKYGKK